MKWLKRIALASLLALIISSPARAAEQIPDFTSKVTVQQSGRVDVIESITYDFGYASRHGIYRYIPKNYEDDKGNEYRPELKIDGVTVDGQSIAYKSYSENNNVVIKIGDPDRTVTGSHRYSIRYHFNELLLNKDGDLLRFNVTGSGWSVPIQNARVQISGPSKPKIACYTGEVGGTDKDCVIDESTSTISADSVGNGSDFTVDALWPQGTVANYLLPYKTPWWMTALFIVGIIYVVAGVLIFIAAIIRWLGIRHAENQAERDQIIIAQYEPPKNLTPGELGLLLDDKATLTEVTATLIQAAVGGVIRIEQVQEKTILKSAQYKLVKLKDFSNLSADERPLLEALFGSDNEVNLKDVDHTKVPQAVSTYQDSLRSSLKAKEFYTEKTKFFTATTAIGVTMLIIFSFTPLIFVSLFVAPLLSMYLYRRVGQAPRKTPAGLKTWAEVEGFKLFLSVTEKDRLAFTDAPARTPKQFSKLLPYAVALGVEKEWAKQFEGIDITGATGWYHGNNQSFTAGYLVGSLNDSFAPAVASSSRTPSSTSSGSFGGGSSGGGFGGGGGGSW